MIVSVVKNMQNSIGFEPCENFHFIMCLRVGNRLIYLLPLAFLCHCTHPPLPHWLLHWGGTWNVSNHHAHTGNYRPSSSSGFSSNQFDGGNVVTFVSNDGRYRMPCDVIPYSSSSDTIICNTRWLSFTLSMALSDCHTTLVLFCCVSHLHVAVPKTMASI